MGEPLAVCDAAVGSEVPLGDAVIDGVGVAVERAALISKVRAEAVGLAELREEKVSFILAAVTLVSGLGGVAQQMLIWFVLCVHSSLIEMLISMEVRIVKIMYAGRTSSSSSNMNHIRVDLIQGCFSPYHCKW